MKRSATMSTIGLIFLTVLAFFVLKIGHLHAQIM